MGAFVLDCSATMAGFLPDERGAGTNGFLLDLSRDGAIAPAHWPLEVAHVLLTAERRKRISAAQRTAILRDLALLPVAVDPETPDHAWTRTFTLAQSHGLSAYDAAYLELAIRKGLPLATRDRALAAAAARSGTPLR